MRRRQILSASAVLALVAMVHFVRAAAVDERRPVDVAIIGCVERPGVYRLSPAESDLVALIARAGGPTAAASGSLRIVRGGEAGLTAWLSPDLKFSLTDGDVVVADCRPDQPRGTSNIEIACVGLGAHPVVVNVPGRTAGLLEVVQALGQPSTAALGVRLFRSPAARHTGVELLSGAVVLVFDPAYVDASRVPPALLADIQQDFPAAAHGAKPLPLERFSRHHSRSLRSAMDAPHGIRQVAGDDEPGGVQLLGESGAAGDPFYPPPAPVHPADDLVPPAFVLDGLGPAAEAGEPLAGFPDLPPDAEFDVDAEPIAARELVEPPGDADAGGTAGMLAALAICGAALAILCMLWLRVRHQSAATPGADASGSLTATIRVPVSAGESRRDRRLEALINDELPLVEEAVSLKAAMELFGRKSRAKTIRLDAADGPPQPHFPLGASRTAGRRVTVHSAASATAKDSPPPAMHAADDAAPRHGTGGDALERALRNVHGHGA
ncbi:MAG: hypothetical protein KY476_04825 [Planctomycetes bacterium]|nr:hypothetical protein [Planctomycetota bacterium]